MRVTSASTMKTTGSIRQVRITGLRYKLVKELLTTGFFRRQQISAETDIFRETLIYEDKINIFLKKS